MSSSAIPIDSNSLLAFPPEFDFIPMIKQINSNFKSSSTSDILSAINSLLLLLKFEQTLFTLSMDNVFDYFIKHLHSENTSIMENCLLLICEMYSTYNKEMQFKDWLRTLIKKLLKLSTLPIESISKLANLALNNIIKNYMSFDYLEQFIEKLESNNYAIAQKAAAFTFEVIAEYDEETRIELIEWDLLFGTIIKMTVNGTNEDIANKLYFELKKLCAPSKWEEILSKASNMTLSNLLLIDRFDMKKIMSIKKKNEDL